MSTPTNPFAENLLKELGAVAASSEARSMNAVAMDFTARLMLDGKPVRFSSPLNRCIVAMLLADPDTSRAVYDRLTTATKTKWHDAAEAISIELDRDTKAATADTKTRRVLNAVLQFS